MKDYPNALFDVSTVTVGDGVTPGDLIAIQEQYIKPILGQALYEDFILRQTDPLYVNLKTYCTACASLWLYYHAFDRKLIFKDFMTNSSEGALLQIESKRSAYNLAQSSGKALLSHVVASAYPLYTAVSSKRISGFLIRNK